MNKTLHCLLVEDSENDALLVVRELRLGGYDVTWERVETAETMRAALDRQPWDIVISDYQMPHFSGLAALELLKASGRDMPFILISGTIGEDVAVAAMKAGAHDYLLKGNLARLVPAIERELRDADGRRERKQVEEALRQSEEQFRAMFESASVGIAQADPRTGLWLRANFKMCMITGYCVDELLRMTVSEITYADDRKSDGEAFQRVVRGEQLDYRLEKRFVRKNGSLAWVNVNTTIIRDSAGQPARTIATIEDITERKRTEEALIVSEVRYRRLFESAKDGILILNAKTGMIVDVNPFLIEMLGFSREEFLGKKIWEWVPFKDIVAGQDNFAELQQKEYIRYECKLLQTADGRRIAVEFVSNVYLVNHQKVILCNIRDNTERKRAEGKIREQAALLDIANDAIYVTTLDCTILFWNRGAERTFGWTSAEVVNRKTTELISPDHDAVAALTKTLLEQGSWSGERWQMTKSGRKVEVVSRLTLVRDEQGQPQSVFAINTDITEKKQLETQFLRSQRLESLGALASGIAHDLNNVLTPILMGAPLLREAVQTEQARNMVAAIETSAKRAADIVKQVLTFARGVQGERVPLQSRDLIREMVKFAGETFPKNIRIEATVAENLWPIRGDATQMHQALLNLCVNARDAMPAGGMLRLTAENIVLDEAFAQKTPEAKPGPHVCLGVSDTGTGIPPEHLDRLFDPFFTTKAPGQGTGLGLSTVLGIARSHGGFVKVRTEVGEGTTFELYLPASPSAEVTTGPAAGSVRPWAHGELILVVDDEEAIREVTRNVLEMSGYKVMTAAEGAEAIRIFGQHHRDIQAVITDMLMPGMGGPSLVGALRAIEPGVRIIGISGLGERTGVTNLQALALAAFLAKPFPIQKLLTALHDVLHPPKGAASP